MRILYLTQWFDPEPNVIKGPAFVRALEDAGHEVTVVTGFPNFPTGRIYPGYRLRLLQRERIDGVAVIRLPLYPSHDHSSLRRSLNFLSFFVSALLYVLLRRSRYDLVYVYHPPITVGLAAALALTIRRQPMILDVQDLWPDTLAATGMRGAERLVPAIGWLCALVYRRAARIVVASEGIHRALINRGVPAAKLFTLRNWANDEPATRPMDARSQGAPFTLIYGGNLGLAQGLPTVADAAVLLERTREPIEFIVYGDGVAAEAFRERTGDLPNLTLRPQVARDRIVPIFQQADALLLTLRDDPLFAITLPSKLQFYLAMGRPIVAAIAGEGAELLRASGAAIVARPDDPEALAAAIRAMAALSASDRETMGRAGRAYYEAHFSFRRGIAETLAQIASITPARALDHAVAPA
jgi:colanic acid biosynthesis glycosyl transferase WcaI